MMRPVPSRGRWAINYYLEVAVPSAGDDGLPQPEGPGAIEDYYLPLADEGGRWCGQGAKALGLDGEATREAMAALLEGRHPRTGEQLGQKPLENGVRAYDLTFSAPKSVSLLAGLCGESVERAALSAHEEAVDAALAMLEERATTRGGKGGHERIDTAGISALTVLHRTSRTLDPQLHTHAIVFAKVQGVDGRWRALDARIVFRAQRTFGAVYQSVLRSELSRTLGVHWEEVVNGQAEIAGVSELTALFSRRSAQIEERLEQKLADWRERHPDREPTRKELVLMQRNAARESRAPKARARDTAELRAGWLSLAREAGWDAAHLREAALERASIVRPAPAAWNEECLRIAAEALASLCEQKSVWTREELEREVAARLSSYSGRSAAAQVRAVEALADGVARELCVDVAKLAAREAPSVLSDPTVRDPGLPRYTTRELLEEEQQIVRWFDHSRAHGGARAPEQAITRAYEALATGKGVMPELDAAQAHAAALVAGSHRAVAVVGPAGAGKTQMLEIAARALRHEGHQVVGVAPTAGAAGRLGGGPWLRADTVAKFLAQPEQPTEIWNPALRIGAGDTLIVDEAGMLSTPDLTRIIARSERERFRVVFVGDQRQLQAVGRGGMFDHAIERLPCVELREVHRFRSPWEAEASLSLRAGRAHAIDQYIAYDRVRSGSAREVSEAMVADWWQAWREGRDSAFSAPTNEQARHLNARARGLRLAAGELTNTRTIATASGETVGVGDLVATRENARRLRLGDGSYVRNRDTWVVERIEKEGSAVLRRSDGRRHITAQADYAREHVELAYFRTTHGVQGLTHTVGGTLVDETAGFRSLYVGMTRGRESNRAYVVCEEDERPRDVLKRALERDRADLGVLRQQRTIEMEIEQIAARREREIERAHRLGLQRDGGVERGLGIGL
jgi:conjugative relaxase-like TrwC/TraI family protein